MTSAAQIPTSNQAVVEKSPASDALLFTRPWFRFFDALAKLVNASQDAPVPVVVGASPFTYDAIGNGLLAVQGGAVTLMEYGRGGVFTNLGVIAGPIPVIQGDQVRITHAGAPTVTLIRQ